MLELLLMNKKKGLGVSYQKFVDALNASGMRTLTSTNAVTYRTEYMRYAVDVDYGTMWGTPYGNTFTNDSTVNRMAQHAFPTEELYRYSQTNRLWCAFKSVIVGSVPAISLNRNGYISNSYGNYASNRADDFIYFDNVQNKMMRWNPYRATEPEPWDGLFR